MYKDVMVLDSEYFRTIKARGVVLSEEQMDHYRIRGIYNAAAEVETVNDHYIQDFANSVHRPSYGEIAVVETSLKDTGVRNPLQIISVIVFVDIYSWHMFAMKHWKVYGNRGLGGFLPLVN